MKVIQSFWTGQQESTKNTFGWNAPEYHWLGWILSANQLSKYYDVELYTDKLGYHYLIECLNLPYSKVHVILDELNHYKSNLWALPKIKAYSLQKEPFLHVDGDVFIWEAFPDQLLKQKLITQNLEVTTNYYQSIWEIIAPNLSYLPEEMMPYVSGREKYACNMGIVGGTDIEFFQKYTQKSFEFVDRNTESIPEDAMMNFNVFFEQVLFYLMAKKEGIPTSYLINEVSEDNGYKGFGDFNKVPHEKTYLHLLGHYKRDHKVCTMLKDYVLRYYPEYFQKLLNINEGYFPKYQSKELDYDFSPEANLLRVQEFEEQLDTLSGNEFLLSRDLFSVNQSKEFDQHVNQGKDVILYLLKGWKTNELEDKKKAFQKVIEIPEMHSDPTVIPIDDIDEMIFYQLQQPKSYMELMNTMLGQLDDDAKEIIPMFVTMIRDRITYFLTHKVLRFTVSS